jgi:hypothetical protein
VWERLLLSAMSERHAGRAETPAAGFFQRARKHIWLASIVVPGLVIVPGVAWFFQPPSVDEVVRTVKEAGFDPLVPANRLRGPGAIYAVEGNSYKKVCDSDSSLLDGKVKQSPTPDHVRRHLEKSRFSLAGDFLEGINTNLKGERLTSVELKLSKVEISEIAMDELLGIQDALLSRPKCREVVSRLLKANKLVCAGYAALSATTSYHVRTAMKMTGNADVKRAEMVKQAIEQHTGSEVTIHNADEFKGDNLFYGIQLWGLCITPDTATEPSVLPAKPPMPKQGA